MSPAIVFQEEIWWQKKVLDGLWQLQELLLKKESMYEYSVSQKLVTIWMILIANAGDQLKKPSKRYDGLRVMNGDVVAWIQIPGIGVDFTDSKVILYGHKEI